MCRRSVCTLFGGKMFRVLVEGTCIPYTGHFIMFCMITNIYNKKTKGPTLMELFTDKGKLKKFCLTTRDVRYVRHGWHGTHRYDIQVLATRVNLGASIFFTAAMIRAFRSARSRGSGGTYTVIYQLNFTVFMYVTRIKRYTRVAPKVIPPIYFHGNYNRYKEHNNTVW
jgi:hypothetical protein